MIGNSVPIQTWLSQFTDKQRQHAIALLTRLQFVSRDTFSEWLKRRLEMMPVEGMALFSVTKLPKEIQCIWDDKGQVVPREFRSLGSEDLVLSVIANLRKSNSQRYLDHPDLGSIKKRRPCHIVLIDDSIGSGDRVGSFIERMMSNKQFLSWWSFGWIRIHIVTFARSSQGEKTVLSKTSGSNHGRRKFPKSTKVQFVSELSYCGSDIASRWGKNSQGILDLCAEVKAIPLSSRLGYDRVMSNIVFYHSVPNTIPGILWCQRNDWTALFPRRSVPEWLPVLLRSDRLEEPPESFTMLTVLQFVKRGRRSIASLSRATGLDSHVLANLLHGAQDAGLLTTNNRLTEVGNQLVLRNRNCRMPVTADRSLYIPTKWCADRETVQPPGLARVASGLIQTESVPTDGEVGQASLERTDAKTASPSLSVSSQYPSSARERGDAHGTVVSKQE